MKLRQGIPPQKMVIDEVLETDHICGVSGVGKINFPQLVKSIEEANQYYSKAEKQNDGRAGETSTCTNQALMRILQWFVNFLYRNNLLPQVTRDFLDNNGYMVDGECNLSESYSAYTSGTNARTGNSMTRVCKASNSEDAGCVPESVHKDDFSSQTAYWRKPSQKAYDLGEEWTEHLRTNYSWLWNSTVYMQSKYDTLKSVLLKARVYAAIPICHPYNQAEVKYCGRIQSDHCIDIRERTAETDINDSYFPFIKKLINKYLVNSAMQIVVTCKKPMDTPTPKSDYILVTGKNPKYHRSMWALDKVLAKTGVYKYDSFAGGNVIKELPAFEEYSKLQPIQEMDEFPPQTGITYAKVDWLMWKEFLKWQDTAQSNRRGLVQIIIDLFKSLKK